MSHWKVANLIYVTYLNYFMLLTNSEFVDKIVHQQLHNRMNRKKKY